MRPNILFIMTDQQRFDALGANGNDVIRTPNLDGLAASAVNVRDYFTQCPVCVPSRCTLFTGRYPHSHRVRENHTRLEADRDIHLFRALKQAGYSLGYVGKNHLLENEEFDRFDYADVWGANHESTGEQEDACNAFARGRGALMRERGVWAGATFHDFPFEATRPHIKASSAIRFLEERPKDRPFCLTVSFSDPHAPHIAPRKYEQVYPLAAMKLHPTREGELAEKARRFQVKVRASGADRATEEDRRRFMAVYFSMISWVDENVGRILSKLGELGLERDTIVVFTSDHGEFCFEHGMCKKDLVLLDSLLRVPLLISWPGRLAPREIAGTFVEEVDVMPTLLDLAGQPVPNGVQGRSFLPLLEGETDSHKDTVYAEICPPSLHNPYGTYEEFRAAWEEHHETPGHQLCWTAPFNVPGDFTKMIRTRDHKYIWYWDGQQELYDLRADPNEWFNLADDPAHEGVRNDLKMRLLEWLALSEDPLDLKAIRELQQEYSAWLKAE